MQVNIEFGVWSEQALTYMLKRKTTETDKIWNRPNSSTIQKVCCHQKLESNLRGNGELWNLSGAVCVADLELKMASIMFLHRYFYTHLVSEVHADLLQHVAGDLPEVHLVSLVLGELPRPGEHGLDGAAGQGVVPLHDELLAVAGDELDVHGVWPLTPSVNLLPSVHATFHHDQV